MIKNDSPPLLRIFLALVFCACSNEDLETSSNPVVSLLKNDLKLDSLQRKILKLNIIGTHLVG
jgi:hypothetical protein